MREGGNPDSGFVLRTASSSKHADDSDLDREGYAPNPPVASSPAPELQAPPKPGAGSKQGVRKVPRGMLDEHALIELTKNPSLTYEQLAVMLECKPGTLRDKRKCPLLAAARDKIKCRSGISIRGTVGGIGVPTKNRRHFGDTPNFFLRLKHGGNGDS